MLEAAKAKILAAKTNLEASSKLKKEINKIKDRNDKLKVLEKAAQEDPNLKAQAATISTALDAYNLAVVAAYDKVKKFPLARAGRKECEDFVKAFEGELAAMTTSFTAYKNAKRALKNKLEDGKSSANLYKALYTWLFDDHTILKQLAPVAANLLAMAVGLK
jgi:hypothetical protein